MTTTNRRRIRGPMAVRTTFATRVVTVVRRIPAGRVTTYGDVAVLAGRPGAARAVGNVMRGCGDVSVPCHRVIASGGRLGGYRGHEALKRQLLELEGCAIRNGRVREFAARRWRGTARRAPVK